MFQEVELSEQLIAILNRLTLNFNKTQIKMKNILTIKRSVILLVVVLATIAFSSKEVISKSMLEQPVIQDKYDPSGTWNYEIETPEATLQNTMTISKDDEGELEVSLEVDGFGTIELEDISFEKMVMEATAEVDGDSVEFEFNFEDDSMEGTIYVDGEEFTITAEREGK